jgi:sirohydrochlorin cobaltochelatase
LWAEVTAAFWKEQPSFGTVLEGLAAADVTVVPLFSSEGYFSQQVLPAELNPRPGQKVTITPALGNNHRLAHIVDERLATTFTQHNLRPEQTAVVVVGHGTRRNSQSDNTTEKQAERLRQQNRFGEILTAYLDQPPLVDEVYQATALPNLVVVPFFIAAGMHTQEDIPEALAIDPTPDIIQTVNGRQVVYTRPVGLEDELYQLVLALAGKDKQTPLTQTVWDNFPAVREGVLQQTEVGQVWLGAENYLCHVADKNTSPDQLAQLTTPAAIRAAGRQTAAGEYRPWATMNNLPSGWVIPTPTAQVRAAALLTLYPHLTQVYQIRSLTQVGERQLGKYRTVLTARPEEIDLTVQQLCQNCLLHPTWHTLQTHPLACAEPCSWWLESLVSGE